MTKFRVRLLLVLAALGALLVTGIGYAGTARAQDTVEEIAYITVLDNEGIYYSSEAAAISAGYSVCDGLDAGLPLGTIIAIAHDAGYSIDQAGYIVGAAIGAFCPGYAHLVLGSGQRLTLR